MLLIASMSGSANGQANRQIDTCITKAVYDSLAIGNEIAHEFGHSGFIENILDQRAVQAKLIENLENQVVVSEEMTKAVSANAIILTNRNHKLEYRIKTLKFQLPIVAIIGGLIGFGIATK